ncbi:MAG: hypothetical protein JWN94_1250 [Betaproteobacteria bacterium]|nr:hypothetical protein [Betaproteobacteria bacterium]
MAGSFHLRKLNWLTGGLHALILSGAAQAESTAVWPFAMGAMSIVSFAAWIGNYRRLRHIADTPLSNIATAAQGYVEIAGAAEAPAGEPLRSKVSLTPCVWYEYTICEKKNDDWVVQDSGASDDPFIIRSADAYCVIDPEGAEIVCSHERTWTEGSHRYTESLLVPREKVYALGNFATVGGSNSQLDLTADVSTLLSEWKKDQPALLKRFDLDASGSIDLKEWELARRQAVREVEARHREVLSSAGTNIMRAPTDGRPFLLSNVLPAALRLRFLRWAWAHAVTFVAAAGLCMVLL